MLSAIKSLLYGGYFVDKRGGTFFLHETGREASCKVAKFEAKNEFIIYKFDQSIVRDNFQVKHLLPFFNEGNAHSMCDYIIFYKKSNSRLFAVICNLKSKNKSNNADQIKSGHFFSQFIYNTACRLHPEVFNGVKLETVSVLFSTIRLYTNRGTNSIINLLSNEDVSETFVFEHKCR